MEVKEKKGEEWCGVTLWRQHLLMGGAGGALSWLTGCRTFSVLGPTSGLMSHSQCCRLPCLVGSSPSLLYLISFFLFLRPKHAHPRPPIPTTTTQPPSAPSLPSEQTFIRNESSLKICPDTDIHKHNTTGFPTYLTCTPTPSSSSHCSMCMGGPLEALGWCKHFLAPL